MRSIISSALALTVLAAPALADDINIYSYRQPELIAPLAEAFTQETGINVNIAFLKKGLIEKLEAEGSRSPADLILTTDISRLNAAVEAGVTQPVQSDVLSNAIPAEYRDPEGNWFGLTRRARVVYASKDRVADGELTTYEDLADPKWQGRICTRSGTHAYNIALTSAMIAHHGEEATATWLTGLKANLARKPQGNDRAQVKAIWAGECDISVGNTYYMGKMMTNDEQKDWAASVRIVFPTFETAGTHVNVSGIALTKSAPNHENAVKFMEFLVSDQAQEIYAANNFEYPITAGTDAADIVKAWGTFTADTTNLVDIAKLRSQALKLVETVDFDG